MKQNVKLFKCLADETRLRILALLLSEGELCVCDIIAALRLPQSTVSRHLAHLRNAGWVKDRRCGHWIYYHVSAGEEAQRDMIPLLKKHLTTSRTTIDDRETLAGFGADNRCA